jgi:hypothetical protein
MYDMHTFRLTSEENYDNQSFSIQGSSYNCNECGTNLFFVWEESGLVYPVEDTNYTVQIIVRDLGRNERTFLLPVMIKGSHFNKTIT